MHVRLTHLPAGDVTRDLLDALPNGVFTVDREGRIVLWNSVMEELTGYSREEVAGAPCSLLQGDRCFHGPCDARGLLPCALFQTGSVPGKRCGIRRKDGTYLPVMKHGRVLLDPMGEPTGAIESCIDMTELVALEEEQARLTREGRAEDARFHGIVGRSEPMLRLYDLVTAAATSDAGVLVLGETGTGKELVASAVHDMSRRRARPFVRVSCAALPESLLESELFGHVRGAFSGAVSARTGRFEAADGGTLFLDEIGDISLTVQRKLLRVLEEQEFERVGSNTPIAVDLRVIAATNRDLPALVEAGEFRQDLYYRLAVVPITLPPLRERLGDIPPLVEHFLQRISKRDDRTHLRVDPTALTMLCSYGWPGNVRELEHALDYAAVLAQRGVIDPSALPAAIQSAPHAESRPTRSRGRPQVEAIRAALAAEDGHRERAAQRLGVTRMALWKWMRELDLRWPKEG